MKTLRPLLALAALLCFSGAGRAATPTYSSFNTNQFYTNSANPILVNLYTNFPGLVITNIYSSNIYVTNIYASNIISGDLIWTNSGPYITPLPFTNAFQITTNGAVLAGRSVWPWWNPDADDAFISVSDIAQGETGVRKLYLAGVDDAASPTNYTSFRAQAVGGAQPSGQINLASTLNGVTSRLTVNVQPDANVANIQLYNNGVLNFGVNDTSGYSGTGTNFLSDDGTYRPGTGTRINPTDQFLPYRFDGATFEDSPLYRIDPLTIGVDTIDANVIAATNLQSGGVVYSRSDGILTNVASGAGFLYNDGTDTNLVWTAASSVHLWTNSGGLLQPIDLTLPLFWTNSVVWGPGTTSVLSQVSGNLLYTNSNGSGTGPLFAFRDNSANQASFGVAGNTALITGANAVDFYDSTRTLRWGGGRLFPTTSGAILGGIATSVNTAWEDLELDGTSFVYGFHDATQTNYSRLAASHTGTNGAIVFDSQSAGTAGNSRPFEVKLSNYVPMTGVSRTNELLSMNLNGTNRYKFMADQPSSGGDGLRIYGDNGTSFVQFGAKSDGIDAHVSAGSGGAVWIGASSASVSYAFTTGGLTPASTGKTLGNITSPWSDSSQEGVAYIYGHRSGTGITNYSRLAINHTGTNDYDRIIFNSTSAGTAGTVGRPFAFTNAPIVLPSFTKAQKATLTTQEGMILYQTDNTPGLRVYQSGAWMMVSTVADP